MAERMNEAISSNLLQTPTPEEIDAVHDRVIVYDSLNETQAKAIAAEVTRLVDTIDRSYFEVGRNLQSMRDGQGFHHLGCRTFEEYTQEHLGFRKSKAHYLIQIYDRANKIGLTEDDLGDVGWSKAREILKIPDLDAESYGDWAEKAGGMSYSDLNREISEHLGNSVPSSLDAEGNRTFENDDGEVFHNVTFYLSDEQYKGFLAATKLAQKISDSTKLGHHIDIMSMSFLTNEGDREDFSDMVADMVNRAWMEFDSEEEE